MLSHPRASYLETFRLAAGAPTKRRPQSSDGGNRVLVWHRPRVQCAKQAGKTKPYFDILGAALAAFWMYGARANISPCYREPPTFGNKTIVLPAQLGKPTLNLCFPQGFNLQHGFLHKKHHGNGRPNTCFLLQAAFSDDGVRICRTWCLSLPGSEA